MYCAGHLIQAAVAHHRAADDGRLLAIAVRLADNLVRTFAGQEKGLDGHPIIETALAELYRETGNPDYLELARQFVEQRGHGLAGDSGLGRRYLQDHVPVRSLDTTVGHVVRASYVESGVADVAAELGDRSLLDTSLRRWDDMVATKTYLTGGNGSRHVDEGFGIALRVPAWSARTRVSVDNEDRDPGPGYHQLRRRWQPGDEITLHLDLTPRWTHPDRRVDAVRGCAAIERGPLVYCFEQADQPDGIQLEDLAVRPDAMLGERPATLPGIGQTIEVTVDGVHLPPPPRVTPRTLATAIAIPYFQWDNRDGRAMRVWIPRANA